MQGASKRVDRIVAGLEAEQWQRLSAGDESLGPRLSDWACIELDKPKQQGWQKCVVVRRSLVEGEKPADLAYVLVFAPIGTTLQEMVTVIGTRWTVEQCFEEAKGEVGLDQYEVRTDHRMVSSHNTRYACSCLSHGFANAEPDPNTRGWTKRGVV